MGLPASSVRLELAPGDVVLRDAGLLHRGTPNVTVRPRTLVTIAYFRADHSHSYATLEHNVAGADLGAVDPTVRRLVAP